VISDKNGIIMWNGIIKRVVTRECRPDRLRIVGLHNSPANIVRLSLIVNAASNWQHKHDVKFLTYFSNTALSVTVPRPTRQSLPLLTLELPTGGLGSPSLLRTCLVYVNRAAAAKPFYVF